MGVRWPMIVIMMIAHCLATFCAGQAGAIQCS
jgi:hypothetical protein